MKDEIKEIIEYLKCEEEYYDGIEEVVLSSDEKVIERDDIELLLDYITNLQEKYDKALELLADFNMPCDYDEGKIPDNYCEEKCDVGDEIYKKCWDKYIELTLRGKSDE